MSDSETARLLKGQPQTANWWHTVCLRYRSSHFCVRSKAAIIILIWNFLLTFAVTSSTPLDSPPLLGLVSRILILPIQFGFTSVLYLFYPLAGFVADVCCGRHKTVTVSLWVFVVGLATYVVLAAIYFDNPSMILVYILLPVSVLLMLIGVCGFQANAVQYGLDQLLDSPTTCLSLFIYWYFWASYVGEILVKVLVYCTDSRLIDFNQFGTVFCVVNGVITVGIVVTLSLSCCKRRWFVVDSGSRNPYKLVYRVLRFAATNKCPIQRSAFTYCEDELPSRIDFGKHKYGGPFTTEEVEDVKTFLSILSVLFAVGFVFTTEIAAYDVLSYATVLNLTGVTDSFFSLGSAPSLFVVLFISLYIFIIRPLFSYYVPGLFKRMGLGMVFYLLAVCCRSVNEIALQIQHHNETCSERIDLNITLSSSEVYPTYVTQNLFCGIAFFFFYPSVFEFICSQSPHAMKGLLIGVYFAIRGVYLLFGVGIMIPFYFWTTHLFSCNLAYYLVNVFIAIVGLVVYTVAARRYKYRDRQRGDYPNIHLFAEEYYGNHQDEPHYDFDPID